jgi:hypothetical protein
MDSEATKCGHLSFAELNNTNFEYWHERLVILQAAFDERLKEQESKQWWYDRRWYAFAALAFTVLFGFLQSIEGAVQVYYAINPPR